MNRRELENEGADLKLIFLLLLKKISIVIISAAAGAAICGAVYGTWYSKAFDNRRYEARSKYYITFEQIDDEDFFAYYYNGYTWNDLLSSDPIMGYAMDILAQGYTREYLDDCVEAVILSDLRVLTTIVRAKSPEEAQLFQDAIEQAVVHYAAVGDKLEKIEIILSEDPKPEKIEGHILRAAITGAVVFTVGAVLILLFMIVIDDGVYLPEEFEKHFALPCAGIDCGFLKTELLLNREHLCKGKEYPRVSAAKLCGQEDGAGDARHSGSGSGREAALNFDSGDCGGVIFTFPQGCSASQISRALHNLDVRECPVICAEITDADERLLRYYYGKMIGKRRKSGKEKPSE